MRNDKIREIEQGLGWKTQYVSKRKKHGYSLIEDKIIKCPNCLKELVQIIKVKNEDKINKISVVCPYCNEESFKHTIEGQILINPCQNIKMVDMKTDLKDDVYQAKIMVKHE